MATDRLVLDSSFALEAILPTSEKWRREAVDLIEAIATRDIDARVPWLFFAELANVVTRRVRSRNLDSESAMGFLERIDSLALHVDLTLEQSLVLHSAAMKWHCGAYDAIYLDLAMRMAIPVATRDRGMVTAARAAGVAIFE